MADKKKRDALAGYRENLAREHEAEIAALKERHEHAMAMASVPQMVVDPNESAALETITGWAPHRDTSNAPAPGVLGAPAAGEEDSLGTQAPDVEPAKDEPKTSAKVS